MIVFPHYDQVAPPEIKAISRAEAVFQLTQVAFNFSKFRTRGLDLLADVVSRARCYRLRNGDLTHACELLEARLPQVDSREAAHG